VVQWFKDTSNPNRCIIGRDLSKEKLSVSKDGGNIDAITASTITSRAFLEAVNKAYAAYTNTIAGDAHPEQQPAMKMPHPGRQQKTTKT